MSGQQLDRHSWCRDIQRDEAVRASEDGRPGPLPTLEEAIYRAGQFMPSEAPQGPKCTERESGLRTERVTLEVTHDLDAPLGDWIVGVIDESLGYDEYVRVVEEAHFDDLAQVAMERDAAIRERDKAKQRHARACAKCVALADKVIGLRDRVAELESAVKLAPAANADGGSNHAAPAASGAAGTGWLTAEERDSIQHAANLAKASWSYSVAQELENILARSSPPEVVLPELHTRCEVNESNHKSPCLWLRRPDVIEALAAAGVTVKGTGPEANG